MFETQATHSSTLGAAKAQNNGAYRVRRARTPWSLVEPVGAIDFSFFSSVAVGFLRMKAEIRVVCDVIWALLKNFL